MITRSDNVKMSGQKTSSKAVRHISVGDVKKQRHAVAPLVGSSAMSYKVTADHSFVHCPLIVAPQVEFFPCSGNGTGTSRNNRGSNGNYWSSTWNSARNARNLNFNSGGVNPTNNNNRYNGFPVRAVQHLSIAK